MRSRKSRRQRNAKAEEPLDEPVDVPVREPEVEQLLAEQPAQLPTGRIPIRIGVLTVGRGQLARRLAERWPTATVDCWILDSFHAMQARETGPLPPNLNLVCTPDWPSDQYDLVFAPIRRRDLAELNRDMLQSAFQRLQLGGELWVGVDSGPHPALLAELREWTSSVDCLEDPRGSVFHLRKTAELKRVREFRSEVVFRDRARLLRLVTRPGVFAHRQLDAGARQILKALEEIQERKILDLGCGSGVIAVALAARDPEFEVWAVDSHARAVEATELAGRVNRLNNLTTVLRQRSPEQGPLAW